MVTGALASPLYPLVYGLIAFAVTVLPVTGAVAAVGAVVVMELGLGARVGGAALIPVATHLGFVALAAGSHAVLLRALAARGRRRRARQLAAELRALRQDARDYRLIASALGPSSRAARPREDEEQLLAIGGAEVIGDAAAWVLATIKRSLGAATVALVWVDDDGDRLVLKELATDVDEVRDPGRLEAAGLLGAVVRDRAPVLLAATKAGHLPYYTGERAGHAAIAVPILDGAHLRGVLCADRPRPFVEGDRDLMLDAAGQLLRTVQAEQVFRAVERAKYEHERFYQATALLGRALTPEQVMDTAFDAAAAIADFDVAMIALYDREQGRHRVAGVRSRPGAAALLDATVVDGLEFKDNTGLASMVVKNRHYLPAGGEPREVTAPIYTKAVKLDDARSLLVLPLLAADLPVGTLTLAARAEKRFGKDVREMLGVIATQVAVSLQNGLLYRQMETMATTDGLTGLTNHRTFQEKFGEVLERAGRHGHKAAVLLCDVDHFKKVNDTYGHPIGDEVLRRVARVLQEVARKIDITARYGGEEFVVVLDRADLAQARAVAERIRIEVGKLVVESDKGPFKVTQSIGVAAFPDDGGDKATLIEHADHALYFAKDSGRNRVVTYPECLAARRGGAAVPAKAS
ncbi:MAG: diguanylate cyclase [Kofleriaceae bacterium]